MRRRGHKGFSITEVLVAIAVLAISITGVLAALAFDAFSSEQSSFISFANSYNRRVMDMLQIKQFDPTLGSPPVIILQSTYPPTVYSPDPATFPWGNAGNEWKDLDAGFLADAGGVVNFWGAPGSPELARFTVEKRRYEVSIVGARVVAQVTGDTNAPSRSRNTLVEVVVTTRWFAKRGIRFARLRGYYSIAAQNP